MRRGLAVVAFSALMLGVAGLMPATPGWAADDEPSAAGSYLAGHYAISQRDLGNALKYMERALADDPDEMLLVRRTFMLLVGEGRIAQSKPLAERIDRAARGAGPEGIVATFVLALEEAKAGNFKAARDRLSGLTRARSNNLLLPMLSAWAAVGAGQVDEAMRELEPLARERTTGVMRDFHAALMLDLAGREADARATYGKLRTIEAELPLRMVNAIAVFHERLGERDVAEQIWRGMIARGLDPFLAERAFERIRSGQKPDRFVGSAREGLAEALFDLGGALAQERSLDTALLYVRLALDLRPDLEQARLILAEIVEDSGRYEEAMKLYRQIPQASPLSWTARLRAAVLLDRIERTDEAITLLRALAGERADQPEPLARIGDLLRAKERFADAIQPYDEAIGRVKSPERRHWALFYSRGIALERAKQWPRAEADFLKALELQPDQPYVLNYIGYSWADQGMHLDRARKMIERAVELQPNDGHIVDSLGWVLYRVGEYPGAVTYLERAVELKAQDPVINDHLGDAYWRVGRTNEANVQWRRALSLDPDAELKGQIEEKLKNGLPPAKPGERKI
jgi:tetratricopeptide (TPR) repeat protein